MPSFRKRRVTGTVRGHLGVLVLIPVLLTIISTYLFGQNLAALEKLLRAAGYQLYNPPRANWGPGFVFTGDVVNGRITNVEEVCPNLYSNMGQPQGAAVVLADYSATDSFSFGAALEFLKGLIGGAVDLGGTDQRSVTVQWKNIRELSYTRMDQWLKAGEPRPVAPRCRAAIEDLKLKNKFKDRTFVITRAVAPEVLIYDLTQAAGGYAKGSAKFMSELQGAVGGEGHVTNSTQLVVEHRLFIGYAPPVKIDEWLPSNLVSGDIAEVRGTPSNLDLE
jgi:hypothetical protein